MVLFGGFVWACFVHPLRSLRSAFPSLRERDGTGEYLPARTATHRLTLRCDWDLLHIRFMTDSSGRSSDSRSDAGRRRRPFRAQGDEVASLYEGRDGVDSVSCRFHGLMPVPGGRSG